MFDVWNDGFWNEYVELVRCRSFFLETCLLGFIPGFIVAFILDTLIVGPIARFFLGGIQKQGILAEVPVEVTE